MNPRQKRNAVVVSIIVVAAITIFVVVLTWKWNLAAITGQ